PGGAVVVSGSLQSVGPVTVLGQSVNISSTGGLSFADVDATAGDLVIGTEGDLSLTTADATGAVDLASNSGTLAISGAVNGDSIALAAPTAIEANGDLTAATTLEVQTDGAFVYSASAVAGVETTHVSTPGTCKTSLQSAARTVMDADRGDD